MDLRQLRYFVTVAEERSVTAAAARLHITQPPLSVQLARLEHELGVALLTRHRRGVDLTDAGRHLLEHARRLLAEVDGAAQSVRRLGEGRSGRLALAFVSAAAWTVLPALLRRYQHDRPDVLLDFAEELPDGVVGAVRGRRADVGVVYLPPPGSGTAREPELDVAVLHREPLAAVVPARLRGRFGDRVDLAALAGEPFVSPAASAWGGLHEHLAGACRLAGFEPRLRQVTLVQTVVAFVGAGLGVSVLPASVAALCGPETPVLPLSSPVPVVEMALLRRRGEIPPPPVQHFLRLALSTPEPDVLGRRVARTGPSPP